MTVSSDGVRHLDTSKNNYYAFAMLEYVITLTWDDESSVWIAESDDIPGLILEDNSFDTLVKRVKIAVPDLLELDENNHSQAWERGP